MRVTQTLNNNNSSNIVDIQNNKNITSNPNKFIAPAEVDSAISATLFLDTTLNTDPNFKITDSVEEPFASENSDSSFSNLYHPMTVTTKATTTSTTATISRQPDKKLKYGFLSNLLSSNSSSHSISSTSSGLDVQKKKSSSSTESSSKQKLFKSWGNAQDNEYKNIEKALTKFQSKDRHKVDVLKSLIPWLKKYTTDRIGPIPHMDTTDTYMDIPIDIIITYRAALMSTLHYAIDRLNQKGVYSNVISFCARVLALCFFKIPGVGFALLQALPVSKSHIKRIIKETVGDDDSSIDRMTKQNEKISTLFPEHLKILCFLNLKLWWRQFENAKRIWGEPPIEMSGNWIRRWQSDDSELFFSFYKHYHIVLKAYLASHLTASGSVKIMTPPFEYITAPGYIHLASFFLLKIESLIHRNIHTITTVIQFEHPRGNGNTNNVNQGSNNGITNAMNPNAAAIGMGSLSTTSINGVIASNADANGNVALGGMMNGVAAGSGKPKVLEMAGRRFVETVVSIVEIGFFQEMCNIWINAVVTKTNMYDVEGVFCLLDFIDTLMLELEARDSIVSSESTSSNSNSTSSDSSSSPPFTAPNLINILDIPSYISLFKQLLEESDHTITILRTISFIYTHFFLLTSQPTYLRQLVKEILLNEEMFERLFCHWSRNVRIYYMRLLVWRLGRIGGGIGKHEDNKDQEISDSGVIIEDNEEIVIDILITLQSRLDGMRLYHEFLSNYTGVMEDVEQVFKAEMAESMNESNSNQIENSNNEESKLSFIPSGKETIAPCFIRWIFPSGSNKSSNSNKLEQKLSSETVTSRTSPTSPTTPSIPIRTTSKPTVQPLLWRYAFHRHTYAGKAISEYESVNQEYAEWCAQVANIERENSSNGNGVNNIISGTNSTDLMATRFPGLVVEYPKYFGNGQKILKIKKEQVKNEDSQELEEQDTSLILDNQYVFIQLPSGNIKVVKLQKDTTVPLGKFGTFHSNDIIGRPFGHSYEIYDRDKVKVIKNVAFYEIDETSANNKEILDDPSKQKLSYQEIEKLKKQGLEGQASYIKDIIKKMVESHSAFDQKTEYSKAKYIKRKEAKFSRVFTPVRPTLYSVWEYFFSKNPGKIRDMRIDTLSQILTLANVRADTKLLVVDDTQGLVITGVMERLGGYGTILGIHDGENHNYDIVRFMNFSKKVNDSLITLSWQQVFKEEAQDESTLSEKDLKYYLRRKATYERIRDAREILWKGRFDCLIIASQYQPESILEALMPYLSGSRPIIIYHINKEMLINACVYMRISKKYLNPQITESWLRQYQVLPGRTHPSMSTSGGGGYLLHATHIIIDESLPKPIPSYMKQKEQKDALEGEDQSFDDNTISLTDQNSMNINEEILNQNDITKDNFNINEEELHHLDNKRTKLD
ncbi:13202_t:CDS:10 [Funneliformis geosporum]|nr:13202_t:CDS:10 [Funneliformis geosporum]